MKEFPCDYYAVKMGKNCEKENWGKELRQEYMLYLIKIYDC